MPKLSPYEHRLEIHYMVRKGATDAQIYAQYCPARRKSDVRNSIEAARSFVKRQQRQAIKKPCPATNGLLEFAPGHFANAEFLAAIGRL